MYKIPGSNSLKRLSQGEFERMVSKHESDKFSKGFNSGNQLVMSMHCYQVSLALVNSWWDSTTKQHFAFPMP